MSVGWIQFGGPAAECDKGEKCGTSNKDNNNQCQWIRHHSKIATCKFILVSQLPMRLISYDPILQRSKLRPWEVKWLTKVKGLEVAKVVLEPITVSPTSQTSWVQVMKPWIWTRVKTNPVFPWAMMGHFLAMRVCVRSAVSCSLQPHGLQPARFLCP